MTLKEYRKQKKLSQSSFGKLLDPAASQGLVWQWEEGVTRVTLHYALEIERVTEGGVSPQDCADMYREKDAA